MKPYIKRPVNFIRQAEFNGWRLKVYGISATTEPVSDSLINEVIHFISSHLPQPAITNERYGVGFLTIHVGVLRNWFLLDWWEHEDILLHKLFSSPFNESSLITIEEKISIIACVHELRVINFESEAWIKTILSKDVEPNYDAYMNLKFKNDQ